MENRIILRHKPNGNWIVKVKGMGDRDIKLGPVDSLEEPTEKQGVVTTLEVEVRKHDTVSSDFFIKLCDIWYKVPPQVPRNFKIKIRKIPDGWKAKLRDMSTPGNPWVIVDNNANEMNNPPDENTTKVVAEVHHENPRWVKVGGRWYYIG